jgi:imidazolonepropionase-like amidohydrolase
VRAIAGAVLIDGAGGPPVSNSVLVISGSKIAMAGTRTNIVIPQGAELNDGSGKYIIPSLIDIFVRSGSSITALAGGQTLSAGAMPAGATVEQARQAVDSAASAHCYMVVIDGLPPAAEDAALEEGRRFSIPVFARVSRLVDAQRLVAGGVAGFIGMITDTGEIPPAFVARMRDLRLIWAPALVEQDASHLEAARRNTGRLAAAGVLIAVAGTPPEREMELLVEAGLSPGDAIVAGTRNGALALRKADELGTLQPGRSADLLMLPRSPLEDIRNLRDGGREMLDGAWK